MSDAAIGLRARTIHAPREHQFLGHLKPYAVIAAVIAAVFLAIILVVPPRRVGDGNEYLAMYLAIKHTLRPWMTDASWVAFADEFSRGRIADLVPATMLRGFFPALHVGGTADFNHFWFYSALAAPVGWFFDLFGIEINANYPFTVINGCFLILAFWTAYWAHRWRGVVAVVLLVATGPVIWFVDKAHTEFMTVGLTISAVAFVTRRRTVEAACCLAACATQNPTFAVPALFLLAWRFTLDRHKDFGPIEVILTVATVGLIGIHPYYYFARYGVPTPQLLAGGASAKAHWGYAYLWLFDPDVGLLPAWPVGIVLLIGGALTWRLLDPHFKPKSRVLWWSFAALYIVFWLYTASCTTNINSGATPGLARYGLWGICLFYVPSVAVANWFAIAGRYKTSLLIAAIASIIAALAVYHPDQPENYLKPSTVSRLVQTYLPGLYYPPADIFMQRYAPVTQQQTYRTTEAVAGPGCRLALIFPHRSTGKVYAPKDCSAGEIDAFADLKTTAIDAPTYFEIPARYR